MSYEDDIYARHRASFGWWGEDQYRLAELENEDTHVTILAGRCVACTWEYAVVRWRNLIGHLVCTYRADTLPDEYRQKLGGGAGDHNSE